MEQVKLPNTHRNPNKHNIQTAKPKSRARGHTPHSGCLVLALRKGRVNIRDRHSQNGRVQQRAGELWYLVVEWILVWEAQFIPFCLWVRFQVR